MEALMAIQNLADNSSSTSSIRDRIFNGIDFSQLFFKQEGLDVVNETVDTTTDADDVVAEPNASSTAKIIEFRGEKVAAFDVDGREMICLPQVFELFLKNMVGGLHTVYTKLRRLSITPLVCNVEQVRTLRTLGAIQSGVNRCKLIEAKDFDKLYDDCTSTLTRPGRPSKRGPFDEWNTSQVKKERHSEPVGDSGGGGGVFNLPPINTQQILMQHLVALAAAQQNQQTTHTQPKTTFEQNEENESGSGSSGTPLNLSKGNSGSESGSISSEMMRNKEDASPNNSVSDRGGCNSNSNSLSSNSNKSMHTDEELIRKIVALIDMANEQFKHEREHLWRERNEMQYVHTSFRQILEEERSLRDRLTAESRKSSHYLRAYKWTKKQLQLTKAKLRKENDDQ